MELVQPILVPDDGAFHEDVVVAVACAASLTWFRDSENPVWAEWFAGPFTKTVRRIKPSRVELLVEMGATAFKHGDATAYAFPPAREFPSAIKRAQVQGLDRERAWGEHESYTILGTPVYGTHATPPQIYLRRDIGMTTGKESAQAAHALMGYLRKCSQRQTMATRERLEGGESPAWWFEKNGPLDSIAEWGGRSPSWRHLKIEDAGRTEVEPGTNTAIVWWDSAQ